MKTLNTPVSCITVILSLSLSACGERKGDSKQSASSEPTAATTNDENSYEPLDLTSAELKDAEKANNQLKEMIQKASAAIDSAKKFCQKALERREDLIVKLPTIAEKATAVSHIAAVDQLIIEANEDRQALKAKREQLEAKVEAAKTALYGPEPLPKKEYQEKRSALLAEIASLLAALKSAKEEKRSAFQNLTEATRAQYNAAVEKVEKAEDNLIAKEGALKELNRRQIPLAKRKPGNDPVLKENLANVT